jgi:hypothetical protein
MLALPILGAWRIVISPMIPQDFPSCYYSSMRNLGRSCYPLDRHAGPVARTWWRPFPGRGVASPETPAPDRESLPATIAQSFCGGPYSSRLAGAPGASNSSSPFRNCTEALDTARASQSIEQAKVPHAVLHESPSEAPSERAERTSHSCGRRNEATESQLGLLANRTTDRLGVPHPHRQRRGSQDSRPSLPAGTGLRWSLLADVPGPQARKTYGRVTVALKTKGFVVPLGHCCAARLS